MSFVVVTLVYILVFLCGEGMTSDQIRSDPSRDYEAIKRYWLRVSLRHEEATGWMLKTHILPDAIRPRYLLGDIHCDHSTRLRQVLRATLRNKTAREDSMLRVDDSDWRLVHLVARWVDQHVPSARQVPTAKQEVVYHHWVAPCLLQRGHPLRTVTCHCCSPVAKAEEGVVPRIVPSWMLVSWPCTRCIHFANGPKLYYSCRPPYRLRNQHLRRRQHRPYWRIVVARMLLSHRDRFRYHLLLRSQRLAPTALAPRTPLITHRRHRSTAPQVPNNERKLIHLESKSRNLGRWTQDAGQRVCDARERHEKDGKSGWDWRHKSNEGLSTGSWDVIMCTCNGSYDTQESGMRSVSPSVAEL